MLKLFYEDIGDDAFVEVFVDCGYQLLFAEVEFLFEGGDVGVDGEGFAVEGDVAGVF